MALARSPGLTGCSLMAGCWIFTEARYVSAPDGCWCPEGRPRKPRGKNLVGASPESHRETLSCIWFAKDNGWLAAYYRCAGSRQSEPAGTPHTSVTSEASVRGFSISRPGGSFRRAAFPQGASASGVVHQSAVGCKRRSSCPGQSGCLEGSSEGENRLRRSCATGTSGPADGIDPIS